MMIIRVNLKIILTGETRVWRNMIETITDVDSTFPAGAAEAMCPSSDHPPVSVSAQVWRAASSGTMLVIGLGAKFILRCLNTTVVHGR